MTIEPKNTIVRTPLQTGQKQSIGNELDDLGMLTMLGEKACANAPDDAEMQTILNHLHDREEELKAKYDAIQIVYCPYCSTPLECTHVGITTGIICYCCGKESRINKDGEVIR